MVFFIVRKCFDTDVDIQLSVGLRVPLPCQLRVGIGMNRVLGPNEGDWRSWKENYQREKYDLPAEAAKPERPLPKFELRDRERRGKSQQDIYNVNTPVSYRPWRKPGPPGPSVSSVMDCLSPFPVFPTHYAKYLFDCVMF